MKAVGVFASILLMLALAADAYASTPTCSGSLCRYTGLVSRMYLSEGGRTYIFFEQPLGASEINNISGGSAANFALDPGVSLNLDAGFFKITSGTSHITQTMYATFLTAFTAGLEVTFYMDRTESNSGYLVIDRVWINSP